MDIVAAYGGSRRLTATPLTQKRRHTLQQAPRQARVPNTSSPAEVVACPPVSGDQTD
jgi:hypothetical protein